MSSSEAVPPVLFDVGANLSHEDFDEDVAAVVESAQAAGVKYMLGPSTNVADGERVLELANTFPGCFYTGIGVHPFEAEGASAADYEAISEMVATHTSVVCVGECGLDYASHNPASRESQLECFRAQLEIAVATNKPLYLHEREAHADFLPLLREVRSKVPAALVHCFTGTEEELASYIDLDCYIGISGFIVGGDRGAAVRAALPSIPLERLVIETDAPYLIPRVSKLKKKKIRRNEPQFLPYVLSTVAECMGLSEDEVAAATTDNALRLFGIEPEP